MSGASSPGAGSASVGQAGPAGPTGPAGHDGSASPPIDPTKNVLDLVAAESKFQNSMRKAVNRRHDDLRRAGARRQDDLRKAEAALRDAEIHHQAMLRDALVRRQDDLTAHRIAVTSIQVDMTDRLHAAEVRRLGELAQQKDRFDQAQAEILRLQVINNAGGMTGQLDKMTTILSERIAKLEQFRYESSGKGGGIAMIIGYLITFTSLAVAVAVAFIKFRPS